jgi:hypothetical protein
MPVKNTTVTPEEAVQNVRLPEELIQQYSGSVKDKDVGLEQAVKSQFITYQISRLAESNDILQINDLVFSMPRRVAAPDLITIDRRMHHYKNDIMRTRSSQKLSLGRGEVQITFRLFFVGEKAINEGLRRLLACFDATPFAFIENRFIRNSLVADNENALFETMAVSLLGITTRSQPGMPGTVVAEVTLQWFNYKPFSPHFYFRQKFDTVYVPGTDIKVSRPTYYDEEDNSNPNDLGSVSSTKAFPNPDSEIASEDVGVPASDMGGLADRSDKYSLIQVSAPVKFPEHSEPLVALINEKERNYPKVSDVHDPSISFTFNEYKTVTSAAKALERIRTNAWEFALSYCGTSWKFLA